MRKGDERKASLLKAAKELFFSRGYAATSVNDILDTQHVSKGSFYHHFESKLEVLTELCAQHQMEAAERWHAAVTGDMSALRQLDLLLYHALPASPEETQMCALLLQLHRTPEGDQVISAMLAAQKKAFFSLLITFRVVFPHFFSGKACCLIYPLPSDSAARVYGPAGP